jgi:hypothetical protein
MYQTQSPFWQRQSLGNLVQGQLLPIPMFVFRPRRLIPVIPTPSIPIVPASQSTVEFDFTSPQAVWVITHNLGQFPSVTLLDMSGNVVMAEIQYVDNNQITATFSEPFAGKAYLNF